MAILIAYFLVVLIWATTPLAIQWSSDSLSFIAAASLRMTIAFVFGFAINMLLRRKLFSIPNVWRIYAAGAIGIFPNMPVVYWSAQFIPSGLVAVIFAMSPFVTGLLMMCLLKHNPFNARKLFALLMALLGLLVIFNQQMQLDIHAVYGIVGILLSCFLFAFSSVMVKKMSLQSSVTADPFNQTLGSLLFSLPGLFLSWWILDGHLPEVVSLKSIAAISYLAILGSLLGITLFFYVLANMSPAAVSLITLMTPILALVLGSVLAHEVLSFQVWLGAGFVVVALLVYIDLPVGLFLLKAIRQQAWQQDHLQQIKNEFHKFK